MSIFRSVALFALSVLLSGAAAPAGATGEAAAGDLQRLVDRAQPGETIAIPPGTYEGPVVIDKALRIRAEGTVRLLNRSEQPALRVSADGVQVEGVQIVDTTAKEAASVLITADRAVFDRVLVRTASYGFQLKDASRNEIRRSTVVRETESTGLAQMSDRRNGIDLYESHENRLIGNDITDMHDGVYLESSDNNTVEGNRIVRSRYGIHCMYTNGTVIRNNTGSFNVTGAMVMAVRDAEVSGNTFYKQSENVHSQGILLFDAHASRFFNNRVEGNRVGLYVEHSSDNELFHNEIRQNFIGIQLIEASGNRVYGNSFSGNVIEAEARSSRNNEADGNFWDSFRGIDADGDGRSDIPYAINPFFQTMVKSRPAFQLFFQSPGMVFLEGLFQVDRHTWTTDAAPLMRPPALGEAAKENSASGAGWPGAVLLTAAAATILLLGVRRS